MGHQHTWFRKSGFSLKSEDVDRIAAGGPHLRSVWGTLIGKYGIYVENQIEICWFGQDLVIWNKVTMGPDHTYIRITWFLNSGHSCCAWEGGRSLSSRGAWHLSWHLALSTLHVALGTWHLAPGTWHLALGTLHLALGTTHLALSMWHVALGTWHLEINHWM